MSVQTELDRLLAAKQDLAAAIGAKGVTVPAAATLDAYPALVAAIQGGLGTFNGIYTSIGGILDFNIPTSDDIRVFLALYNGYVAASAIGPGTAMTTATNFWATSLITSSIQAPQTGFISFTTSGNTRHVTWTICADGSASDRDYAVYVI